VKRALVVAGLVAVVGLLVMAACFLPVIAGVVR